MIYTIKQKGCRDATTLQLKKVSKNTGMAISVANTTKGGAIGGIVFCALTDKAFLQPAMVSALG